jgi:hypothetical protein
MLTVRRKASADWLLIFSACMPCHWLPGLVAFYLIGCHVNNKKHVAGGLVDGYHHCRYTFHTPRHVLLAATQSLSRDKKVTASRDLPRGDCVTDSVREGV